MAKEGFGWWYKVLGFSCVVAMQADDVLKGTVPINYDVFERNFCVQS